MMKKKVFEGDEARGYILEGIRELSKPVEETMGPAGRHVIIENPDSEIPMSTRDGVEVARSISFANPTIEMGAQLAKDAATQAWQEAGDGTTTTIVLTKALCQALNRNRKLYNPNLVVKGIHAAAQDAIDFIDSIAIPVNEKTLVDVSVISANNDPVIGQLVADVIWKVGSHGSVVVKEGRDKVKVDILSGSILKAGWLTEDLVNNPRHMVRSEHKPYVCVTDFSFQKSSDVIDILEMWKAKCDGRPFVLIGKEFIGDARSIFIRAYKEIRPSVPVLLIEAPFDGEEREMVLRDIAVATGSTFLGDGKGHGINDIVEKNLLVFGTCERVEAHSDETRFVDGGAKPKDLAQRIESLKKAAEAAENSHQETFYKNRLAWMTGKTAIISIGGMTPSAKNTMMHRLDDALRSSKCALDEGEVPGGGVAYLMAWNHLMEKLAVMGEGDGFFAGYDAVAESLLFPLMQILKNAGLLAEEGMDFDSVKNDILEQKDVSVFDVFSGSILPLSECRIVDSAKVVKTAIRKACDTGGVFVTTEVLVVNEKQYNHYMKERLL